MEKVKSIPFHFLVSCVSIVVGITLYAASAKSTAEEALKLASETHDQQKQIIMMYGEIQRSIGVLEGRLSK